ncbi:YbjP/YqhG family protein [Fundidesulfovibrio agrisoli]|uniref:YbjP/YqhG family protein n=1 Tax=Fundidesulfovibrio agrisoli TaxID=2922717 RepID=UPI001FAC6206|nr:YbjP/YqhG family protein [Fundidesulfovibrio agrisoli]
MIPRARRDFRRLALGCLVPLIVLLLAVPVPGRCAADESEAILQVYRPLLAEYSRLFLKPQPSDPVGFALEKNMFSSALQKLFKAEQRLRNKEGMGRLDFDLFFNAQDECGKPLKILGLAQEKDSYLMTVTNGCKGQKPYVFVLVKESGRWVMDDARYGVDGKIWTLQGILKGK